MSHPCFRFAFTPAKMHEVLTGFQAFLGIVQIEVSLCPNGARDPMNEKSDVEHDEEMMRVPKHFEIQLLYHLTYDRMDLETRCHFLCSMPDSVIFPATN